MNYYNPPAWAGVRFLCFWPPRSGGCSRIAATMTTILRKVLKLTCFRDSNKAGISPRENSVLFKKVVAKVTFFEQTFWTPVFDVTA